jgi:hypothetical protein
MGDGVELISIGEIDEGLLLEMSDGFWRAEAAARAKMAAQIVYTMAALEDGKEVRFLKGALPAPIEIADGSKVTRPVTRHDYGAFQPWIQVTQPVAGATVGAAIPIELILRDPGPVVVRLRSDGKTIGRMVLEGGSGSLDIEGAGPGAVVLFVSTGVGGKNHSVGIPLRIAGSA